MATTELPLAEWIVLTLIAEQPRHGFAVAALTAREAEIGQIWYVSQPMVYRSIAQLAERGLIEPIGTEDGVRGPRRQVYAATRSAKLASTRWLNEPVTHLRDIRAGFVIKLVLLRRRKSSAAVLIDRQRLVVDETEAEFRAKARSSDALSQVIHRWRMDTARATRRLLNSVPVAESAP